MRRLAMVGVVMLAGLTLFGNDALADGPRHYPRGRSGADASAPPLEHGSFRLRAGLFQPRGDSDFWDQQGAEAKDWATTGGDPGDFDDVEFGADLLWSVNRGMSVVFSTGYYDSNVRQQYRFLEDFDTGDPLRPHTSSLSMVPLTMALYVYPAGRDAPVVPYLGAGGGLYWWRYRKVGEVVAPADPDLFILSSVSSDGVAAGFFVVGGIEVPVRPNWSIFAEGRWQRVNDDMSDDFDGEGEIDLSGTTLSGGVSFKF